MTLSFQPWDLYVSPDGEDTWSGKLATPNEEKTDGPLRTIEKARDAVRSLKLSGRLHHHMTVWIRGGRYELTRPITFTPEDSASVSYEAYPGESPIFEGGKMITGWREEHVRGADMWVVDLPEVQHGKWYFRQLFVNGERRARTRAPRQGYYRMAGVPGLDAGQDISGHLFDGADTFQCEPGDVKQWANLTDVDVVVPHFWVGERLPIRTFDEGTNTVTLNQRSRYILKDDVADRYADYYVENVWEALNEPGDWYLDRTAGRLHYIPRPGETLENTEVTVPCMDQLLRVTGQPQQGRFVDFLRFKGLTFRYADWHLPDVSAGQGASSSPGALVWEGARYGAIEDCVIAHIGLYGIEIGPGCEGIRVEGNEIVDVGAGGIKIGGDPGSPALYCGRHRITDNHIHQGGRVFLAGIGIFSMQSFGNVIAHNEIHDLYYTGISCGWVWGYAESVSKDNRIEKNHIYDIGHGVLSDMGGIYMLGVQPGSVVRGNLIHDIEKKNYGGWAIYLDEGSSHIVVEQNICYHVSSQVFHQHYGRENVIRNNIFAFGNEGAVALTRVEEHRSFTFERNIVVTQGAPAFIGGYSGNLEKRGFASDLNLFWDTSGQACSHANGYPDKEARFVCSRTFDQAEMRLLGYDLHSAVGDPKFRDPEHGDFTVGDDSPAVKLGFVPFVLDDVGPRPASKRGESLGT